MAFSAILFLALAGASLVLSLPQPRHKLHHGMSDYHLDHFFNAKSLNDGTDFEYDLATPWQTEEDGEYLSHHLGEEGKAKSRRRRSADEDLMKNVNFKMNVFGEEHHFRLKRNDEFLNPNKVLVVIRNADNVQTGYIDKKCYYHGDLKSHDDSEVAMSNCNNQLTGYIRKRREVYHVHPLPDDLKTHEHNPESHSHLIVVDKKRDLPSNTKDIFKHYDERQRRQTETDIPPENTLSPGFKTCSEETLPPGDNNTANTADLMETLFLNSYGSQSRIFQRNYVQAAAFLDQSMVRKHGQRIEFLIDYTLSMFNMVSIIYQPKKTLYPVTVVLNRIEILTSQPADLYITQDSKFLLENFCMYQSSILSSVPETWQWNHAFLITGYGLCFGRNTDCGELGRAPIEGVCQPDRQCSVNREGGLNTAFVLAHELGHNVGMFHDGHPTKAATCPYREGFLMAPSTGDARRIWDFSLCSRANLRYYLSQEASACMYKGPAGPVVDQSLLDRTSCKLPGIEYNANDQCRLQFMHLANLYRPGHAFKFCSRTSYGRNSICFHLFCDDGNPRKGCYSTYTPAMDGTRCGAGKVCYNFRCVDETTVSNKYCAPRPDSSLVFTAPPLATRPAVVTTGSPVVTLAPTPSGPVDGQWTPFSAYSSCQGVCGFGVRFRTRSCTNPRPMNGGKDCVGESRVYEQCMKNACDGDRTYREHVCNKHRSAPPFVPSMNTDSDQWCKVECLNGPSGASELLQNPAPNGTPCPTGACFQGKCTIGCDGVQNSGKVVDACGLCGGNGTRCKNFQGSIKPTWTQPGVYSLKIRSTGNAILTGSWNISVKETAYFPGATMRLRDSNRFGVVFYYVNGPGVVSPITYGFEVASTRGIYTNRPNQKESLAIANRINRPLIVEVNYTSGPVPSYDFYFTSPVLAPEEKFEWKQVQDWSVCSTTCGHGIRGRVLHCINKLTLNTARYSQCVAAGKPTPAYVQQCIRRPCSIVNTVARIIPGSAGSGCLSCLRLIQRECVGFDSKNQSIVLPPRFCPDQRLNYIEKCGAQNETDCALQPMSAQITQVCGNIAESTCQNDANMRDLVCADRCRVVLAQSGNSGAGELTGHLMTALVALVLSAIVH